MSEENLARSAVVQSVLEVTAEHLAEEGGEIVERTAAGSASADEHEANPRFRQAQIDGVILVFHVFSKADAYLDRGGSASPIIGS